MGIRARPRLQIIGLLFAAAACGQTAEAPSPNDLQTSTGDATDQPPTTTDTAATTSTSTATTTISPETTIVNNPTDSTVPGGLHEAPTAPTPVTVVPSGSIDPTLSALAERAVSDLAGRLGVAASAIEIVATERVVWPDSSLGCPAPDMTYLQVQTDGFRVELTSNGTTYSYHGGGNRIEPFLCEKPDTRIPKQDDADI